MADELYGLQIDLCCVVCGNVPTSDAPLFEMQNHFYICQHCLSKEEEQRGKRLKGVDGSDINLSTLPLPLQDIPLKPAKDNAASPANDIFSILEISSDAKEEEVLEAINSKTRFWIKHPRSDKREHMREQLQDWQDKLLNDPQFLARERQYVQLQTSSTTSTLSVDSREVATIKEFVSACEQSMQAWQDGEMHLRSGELEHWIHPLTQNIALTRIVASAAESTLPNFQALNSVLYHLLPERPFRLYQQNQWQSLDTIKSIPTLKQLTVVCDRYWDLIMLHLYYGALLSWLKHSQGCQDIQVSDASAILPHKYKREYIYQSLGLELLLEHITPTLRRPELTFIFDGSNGSYTLSHWDKEIAHQSVEVVLHNITRGAVIVTVTLEIGNGDPRWITLAGPQPTPLYTVESTNNGQCLSPLYNRPGAHNPVRFTVILQNLQQMEHGKTFYGKLCVSTHTTNHSPSVTHDYEYPLTLSTIDYRQGFRWHLWRWGLRGGWPGLIRNFLAGTAFSLIFFLLIMAFVHTPPSLERNDPLTSAFLDSIIGTKSIVVSFLSYKFFLFIGLVAGVIGSGIGWQKGHANYPDKQNAREYREAGFWCSLVSLFLLCYASWSYNVSGQIVDANWLRFAQIVGCILASLLMYLSICVLSLTRLQVERWLRRNYSSLLKPQGSEK